MKRVLVFLALAALFGGAIGEAFAKSSGTQNRTLVVSTRKQNGNNWEVWQNNRGMDFAPNAAAYYGGFWPKGSRRNYIFGGGLWVGSIDTTGGVDTLVSWAFNPNSGYSMFGPCSPNGDDSTGETDSLARVYLSTDPFDRQVWPVRDSLGKPVYQSMQDAWAIANDVDTMYARSPDKPMGVQIIRTSYAWQFEGLADILLYSFEIKNVTKRVPRYKPNGIPLKRVIIGLCMDADIGNESGPYANDKYNLHASWYHRQVGDSVPRNLAMQYQTSQEPGWTIPPPYWMGVRFLEGPTNNTGSTIQIRSNNYPQYNRDILPGQPLGMTASKVFTINIDPSRASQRYLELAGYYFLNPIYEPYDNDFPGPSDHRFLQSSGPFNLPVDSTVHIVVAVVAGQDSASVVRASDRAQDIYDNWRNPVRWVRVTSPNGGEVLSGTTAITWTSNGTLNDSVDLYVTSNGGITWDTLAANQPNNGSYSWNTTRGPDGTRYLVGAFFHNAAIAAWDFSDSTFTVNNTGNGPPDVQLYVPVGGEFWSGVKNILWYARSPGGRSLQVNLRYSWDGKRTWQAIASNVPNTGSYAWDTRNFPNGNQYYVAVTAWDSLHLVGDTSGSWFTVDNTHQPAGQVVHDSGGATTVEINPYVVDPPRVTGHRYRIRFLPIGKDTTVADDTTTALYSYDLWDLDLGQRVITNRATSVIQNNSLVFDNSPVVDGLRVEMKHRVFAPFFRTGVIVSSPSYTDTVFADTVYVFQGFSGYTPMKWSARGRDFVLTWHRGGGSRGDSMLWVTVRDFTNQVDVPFEGGRNLSGLRASSWAFGVDNDSIGYQTIDSVSCSGVYNTRDKKKARWLYLCGFRYLFNYHYVLGQRRPDKMVWARRPADGDVWYIQQAGQRPPHDGDVYTVQTQVGVEEARNFGGYAFSLGQAYPNPATHQATIPFSLAKKGKATLKVYNVTGALVRNLVDEVLDAGRYQAVWDGRNDHGKQTACGVYLYRLEAPGRTAVRKMVVLR